MPGPWGTEGLGLKSSPLHKYLSCNYIWLSTIASDPIFVVQGVGEDSRKVGLLGIVSDYPVTGCFSPVDRRRAFLNSFSCKFNVF